MAMISKITLQIVLLNVMTGITTDDAGHNPNKHSDGNVFFSNTGSGNAVGTRKIEYINIWFQTVKREKYNSISYFLLITPAAWLQHQQHHIHPFPFPFEYTHLLPTFLPMKFFITFTFTCRCIT